MLTLSLPKRVVKAAFKDRCWAALRSTWLEPYIQHASQLPLARDIHAKVDQFLGPDKTRWAPGLAEALLASPLRGAGYAYESRRWLMSAVAESTGLDLTGANSRNYNLLDFVDLLWIGEVYTVAGTVTANVLSFDLYTAPNGLGTKSVTALDGTNGTLTAPTVASQAIGNVLYKDWANTLDTVKLVAGGSIQVLVTTTCTAGNSLPIILVCPRAETYANLSVATASA